MADLLTAVAGLAASTPGGAAQQRSHYIDDEFITRVLRATRIGHNSRNASCYRLASLARSLHHLGHRPDFGFMHNFTQSCRYAWTGFTPQVRRMRLLGYISGGTPHLG